MTKTAQKIIGWIIGILLIAALFVGLAWGSSGFTNWNAETWFNSWGKNRPTTSPPTDDVNTELNVIEENGIAVKVRRLAKSEYATMDISEDNEGVYSLSATPVPEDAFVLDFVWSIEWGTSFDPEWTERIKTEPVTDYISFYMGIDGSGHANANASFVQIVCHQPFGCQIEVVVSSASNPSVRAVVRCDYTRYLESVTVTLGSDNNNGVVNLNEVSENASATNPYKLNFVYNRETPDNKVLPRMIDFTPKFTVGTLLVTPVRVVKATIRPNLTTDWCDMNAIAYGGDFYELNIRLTGLTCDRETLYTMFGYRNVNNDADYFFSRFYNDTFSAKLPCAAHEKFILKVEVGQLGGKSFTYECPFGLEFVDAPQMTGINVTAPVGPTGSIIMG